MTATMRTVEWGDALLIETFKSPGGLKFAVDVLRDLMGPGAGSRPSFIKLTKAPGPDSLTDRDRWRAWMLLCALQQEPNDWGIGDDAVPPAIDATGLRDKLWCAIRDLNPEPADLASVHVMAVA